MVRWFHKTMKSIEPVEYEIGCCECMHINCLRHFLLLSLFVVMISNIFPDSWIRYLIKYPLGTHQVGNLPICRRPALQCCISCLKEGPVIGALGCPSRNDLAKRKRIAELFGGWEMMQIMSAIMFLDVFAIFLGSHPFLFGETSWIYPTPQVGPHVF